MIDADNTPLEFPCTFPVKAMVRTGEQGREAVLETVARHAEFSSRHDVRSRASRNGRFESITIEVRATSREHLETIYAEVRELDVVVMVL